MTDKIEPALSKDEWGQRETWVASEGPEKVRRHLYVSFSGSGMLLREPGQWKFQTNVRDLPRLIAVANAALNHSDPRKVTHLDIEALRETARVEQAAINRVLGPATDNIIERLKRIADALESYLPPTDA